MKIAVRRRLVILHQSVSFSARAPFALKEQKKIEQGMSDFEGEFLGRCHKKARKTTKPARYPRAMSLGFSVGTEWLWQATSA
jgi:hypothetical protein